LSLNLTDAIALIKKMASNQSWNKERVQPHKRGGMHQLKEADTVSTKLDLIMKKEVMHISDSHMTCKECGDVGHSRVNCPEF
jgi:hypothetical protein